MIAGMEFICLGRNIDMNIVLQNYNDALFKHIERISLEFPLILHMSNQVDTSLKLFIVAISTKIYRLISS